MPKHLLMDGVWADENGDLHFSIPDLLRRLGWPDDPEHRAKVENLIRDVLQQQFPGTPITEVD